MSGPMTGVRVVELTTTIAGPAAGATLADWGADVIKVEPPKGDNFRYILGISTGRGADDDFKASPPFYAINRGKRSVVLDLKTSEGVNAIHKLLATADVFLSNYRQKALEPFGLDADAAANRYPRLVVCTLTGYGRVGPDKDVAGYDVGAFYARSGAAASFTALNPKHGARTHPADPTPLPPQLPAGFGDVTTSMAAVAGISAALHDRHRTGNGQIVDTSLLRTGSWVNFWDFTTSQAFERYSGARSTAARLNPLLNVYRTGDDRLIWLLGMESQRHFPGLCKAIDRPEWIDDARYTTTAARAKNCRLLIQDINARLAELDLEPTLRSRFTKYDVWWQPVQTALEALSDEHCVAAGMFAALPPNVKDLEAGYSSIPSVASPVDFSRSSTKPKRPSPTLGEHTADVLRSIGVSKL